MSVDGEEVTSGVVPSSAPLFVHGQRLPGHRHLLRRSRLVDYYDRAPFPFNSTIGNVNVRYTS